MPKATANLSIASLFHNLAVGELIDQLGHAKAEAAEVKAREDALKAELIARGVTEGEGALFRATVSESLRQSLDAEQVKAEMGQSWYAARCKIAVVTAVRVSARTGARQAA